MIKVPVVDKSGKPLMPTTPNRAASWVKTRKATPFWNRGIWCVRLNCDPSARNTQEIVVGIDPGSKKEGYTVKSESSTYLNIQSDSIKDVKDKIEQRRNSRRSRRSRKTPCRKNKTNRVRNPFPPSTRARWDLKLRILAWIRKIYPITHVIVEDIAAKTKPGKINWNKTFSPLETGKKWFYDQIRLTGVNLTTIKGYETAKLRNVHGLTKTKEKLAEEFSAHCVDSWVMANSIVGGHIKPDNVAMVLIRPLRWLRRQLHYFNPKKGGVRIKYGSTRSEGFTRGSLVNHPKHGQTIIGGSSKGRVSLHNKYNFTRITQLAKPTDIEFITYLPWLTRNAI